MAGAGKGFVTVSLEVKPSAQALAQEFELAGRKFTGYKPAFQVMAPALVQGLKDNLISRGQLIGATWPKGNPGYLKRKAKEGLGAIPMHRTGRLLTSMRVLSLTEKQIKVGTSEPGAPKANFKDGFRFAGVNQKMQEAAIDAIRTYVDQILTHVRSLR